MLILLLFLHNILYHRLSVFRHQHISKNQPCKERCNCRNSLDIEVFWSVSMYLCITNQVLVWFVCAHNPNLIIAIDNWFLILTLWAYAQGPKKWPSERTLKDTFSLYIFTWSCHIINFNANFSILENISCISGSTLVQHPYLVCLYC